MAAGKGGLFDKIWRFVRTIYFMLVMVASLLVSSLPVLVAIGDVLVSCVLISSFTCVNCYSFIEHLHRHSCRSSLSDIPVVSVIRSLIITSVYMICDGPMTSHGQYLGTVTLCSAFSALLLSVKRLVAISGCGHLPHEECPKALLAAVLPFISKLLNSADSESK